MSKQSNNEWLENASLNLNRAYFEDHLGHSITDEEWEYMHDIPILTMDDWYGLLLQSQEYLKNQEASKE
tara:strand:- start:859 stop:1065 length:207 start_codon:yes stop_codon:yes gene_type:complete